MTRSRQLCKDLGKEKTSRRKEQLSNGKLTLHLFAVIVIPLTTPALPQVCSWYSIEWTPRLGVMWALRPGMLETGLGLASGKRDTWGTKRKEKLGEEAPHHGLCSRHITCLILVTALGRRERKWSCQRSKNYPTSENPFIPFQLNKSIIFIGFHCFLSTCDMLFI